MSVPSVTMRILAVVMGTTPLAWNAHADQITTVPRIGVLTQLYRNSVIEQGLRDGLRELGYVEGKNITIERRYGVTGEELRSAATELISIRPDVIVVSGTLVTRTTLETTRTIPVVFLAGDPVATRLAASLAKPGGNA